MGQYKSQESRISKHRQEISRDIQWSPKETTLKIYDFYFHIKLEISSRFSRDLNVLMYKRLYFPHVLSLGGETVA